MELGDFRNGREKERAHKSCLAFFVAVKPKIGSAQKFKNADENQHTPCLSSFSHILPHTPCQHLRLVVFTHSIATLGGLQNL